MIVKRQSVGRLCREGTVQQLLMPAELLAERRPPCRAKNCRFKHQLRCVGAAMIEGFVVHLLIR